MLWDFLKNKIWHDLKKGDDLLLSVHKICWRIFEELEIHVICNTFCTFHPNITNRLANIKHFCFTTAFCLWEAHLMDLKDETWRSDVTNWKVVLCWERGQSHPFLMKPREFKGFCRQRVSTATRPVSLSVCRPAVFLLCNFVLFLYFHGGASNKPLWLHTICVSVDCVAIFLLAIFCHLYSRLDCSRSQMNNTTE